VEFRDEPEILSTALNPESPIFKSYAEKGKKERGKGLTKFTAVFDAACIRAWGNLDLKRFSPHDIRDFLQSTLESQKVNDNVIAPFLGHRKKGTDKYYSSHGVEELQQVFKNALPFLVPKTVGKLELRAKHINNLKFKKRGGY
jgi:integrase